MYTQQTTTTSIQNKNVPASEVPNIWLQVLGKKTYRRAIRKDHSARYKHTCPWCESTATIPYSEAGSSQAATQRLCDNCCFAFTPPEEVPPGIACR